MKKAIILLAITGCYITAIAQEPNPDTSNKVKNTYQDSIRMNSNDSSGQPTDSTSMRANTINNVPINANENSPLTDSGTTRVDSTNAKSINEPVNSTTNNTLNIDSTTGKINNPNSIDSLRSVSPATSTMPSTNAMPANNSMEGTNVAANPMNSPMRGVNNPGNIITGLDRPLPAPLLNTWVPPAVVNQIKNQHGDKLYDITMLKVAENQYAYSARIHENGVYKAVLVNDTGAAVTQ